MNERSKYCASYSLPDLSLSQLATTTSSLHDAVFLFQKSGPDSPRPSTLELRCALFRKWHVAFREVFTRPKTPRKISCTTLVDCSALQQKRRTSSRPKETCAPILLLAHFACTINAAVFFRPKYSHHDSAYPGITTSWGYQPEASLVGLSSLESRIEIHLCPIPTTPPRFYWITDSITPGF